MSAEIGGVPPVSQALRSPPVRSSVPLGRLMNTPSHDFVTVEMRGLKAALVVRAQAQRVSVSALVRSAVVRELGIDDAADVKRVGQLGDAPAEALPTTTVKLSIRFTATEAAHLTAAAREAGQSRAAFISGLIAGVPVLTSGGNRANHLAALIESSAEISTLSRNLHHLTALLRQGAFRSAQEYRPMLDTLCADVRANSPQRLSWTWPTGGSQRQRVIWHRCPKPKSFRRSKKLIQQEIWTLHSP